MTFNTFIITSFCYLSSLFNATPSCQLFLQQRKPIISGKVTYFYSGYVEPDSIKKIFIWKDMQDFRLIAGGPVSFEFNEDSTILQHTGRGGITTYTYKKIRLTDAQRKLVPSSFLNKRYELLGVFYEPAQKSDGFFIAFYSNGKNTLAVWHEGVIGFVIGLSYFSITKENDFKNANYYFPYRNKIRF